jgi:hypothetical protein
MAPAGWRAAAALLLAAASVREGAGKKRFSMVAPPPETDEGSFKFLCNEYEEMWVQGSGVVKYGQDGTYSYTVITADGPTLIKCDNDEREGDPLYGVVKSCWWTGELPSGMPTEAPTPKPSVDPSLTFQTVCLEDESTELTGPGLVRYGDPEHDLWFYKEFEGASDMVTSLWCSNAVFGDPDYGTYKQCQWSGAMPETEPPTPAPTVDPALSFTFVAEEGGEATLLGPGTLRYGADESWLYTEVTLAPGEQRSLFCTNEVFGRDPLHGTVKACYYSGDAVASPTSSPVEAPTPGPVDGEPGDPYQYVCAEYESGVVNEDGTTPGTLRYGLQGYYVFRRVTGREDFDCSNEAFGRDPIYGWVKACYFLPDNSVLSFSRPKVKGVKPKKKVVTRSPTTKKPTPLPTTKKPTPLPTTKPTRRPSTKKPTPAKKNGL